MFRPARYIVLLISSLLFISASIAAIASRAGSQETDAVQSDEWQPYASNFVAPQPNRKMPPPNVSGCWSGTLDDEKIGAGTGFTFIVQKGTKLTKGTMIGVSFPAGPNRWHGITGSINNKGSLKLHFHQQGCFVGVHGKVDVMSEEVSGTYSVNKACRLGRKLVGTFDFTFDPTGTTCP